MKKIQLGAIAVFLCSGFAFSDQAAAGGSSYRMKRAKHAVRAMAKDFHATKIAVRARVKRPWNSKYTLGIAKAVLGRRLTLKQKIMVLAAHNVAPLIEGQKIDRAGIRARTSFLRRAFTNGRAGHNDRKVLMDRRVVGDWDIIVRQDQRGRYWYGGRQIDRPVIACRIAAAKSGYLLPSDYNVRVVYSNNSGAGAVTLPGGH